MSDGLIAATKKQLSDHVSHFKRVVGAVELAAAIERQNFGADAYVVPLESRPGPNQVLNAISHNTQRGVAVIFQVRSAGDPTGDKAMDDLEERIGQVIKAVLGFSPGDNFTPFQYAGGRLLDFVNSAVIWTEEFTTSYMVRSVP